MRKRQGPRLKREHETRIGTFRVARGYTLKKLAGYIGASPGHLSSLQNGMTAPFYATGSRKGHLKPSAELLSLILEAPIAVLWPRDICDIERMSAGGGTRLFTVETLKASMGTYTMINRPDQLLEKKELAEKLAEVMATLSFRERFVLTQIYMREKTLSYVGIWFGRSKTRIQQIERRALRKIRHPSRSRLLKDFVSF